MTCDIIKGTFSWSRTSKDAVFVYASDSTARDLISRTTVVTGRDSPFAMLYTVFLISDCSLFRAEFGGEIMDLFAITRIAANDVTLKPSLPGIEVAVKEGLRRE